MCLSLLVAFDGYGPVENFPPTLAFVPFLVDGLVVLVAGLSVRHMGARGTGIAETASLPLIGVLSGVGEGKVMNGDNLHSAVVKGGVEVALVVVITPLYG